MVIPFWGINRATSFLTDKDLLKTDQRNEGLGYYFRSRKQTSLFMNMYHTGSLVNDKLGA